MKLKWVLLFGVIALIVGFLVFSGCGKQNTTSSSDSNSMGITNISPYAIEE